MSPQVRKFMEISGWVVGVAGFLFGFYFYEMSKKERGPIFLVEPVKTTILNSKEVSTGPITIYHQNGQRIVDNLTSVRFYFFNYGKESIKTENILKDIVVSVTPEAHILYFKILKETSSVNKLELTRIDTNSVKISFKILENEDGLTGEIVLVGNPDAGINISGKVEGAKNFHEYPASVYLLMWRTFKSVVLLFFGLIPLCMGLYSEKLTRRRLLLVNPPNQKDLKRNRRSFITICIMVVLLVIFIVAMSIVSWHKEVSATKERPQEYIPASLK